MRLQMLIPAFQQQFIHIQLQHPRLNTLLDQFRTEVICPMKRQSHTALDLLPNSFKTIKLQLRALRRIISMEITYAWSQYINGSGDKILDVGW